MGMEMLTELPKREYRHLKPNAQATSTLKLVHTNINYRVQGSSITAIFFPMIILSMHMVPRINGMLDFILYELRRSARSERY